MRGAPKLKFHANSLFISCEQTLGKGMADPIYETADCRVELN